jgi:CRISPR/Cas system CSM-associated protein Csm3 (group 7 of RAMP superfamily)
MLLSNTPYFYSALITLECQTPLSIKANESDLTIDTRLVRDVNGYPILPGTSIAGVLRSVAEDIYKTEDSSLVAKLFGQASNKESDSPSQIQVSFGFVHNTNNQPIVGLDMNAIQSDDPMSSTLKDLMPIMRDQVALNEYGTAAKSAKMDRTAVPKGTRFSFELNWATDQENEQQWQDILSWLNHPSFRIGGLTHRGFGKVKVQSIKTESYNFEYPEDLQKWQANHAQAFNAQNGKTEKAPDGKTHNFLDFSLSLQAEDFWRVGQGNKAIKDYEKEPDIKPYTETIIEWPNDKAKLKAKQVVIPASGIKGALRHRTLFHFRRLMDDYSDGLKTEKDAKQQNSQLIDLFGDISGETAKAGTLILDDIYLETIPLTKVMMHNKIDRFTGGTIDGALFSEELLYGGGFTLEGQIRIKNQSKELLEAFKLALLDLAQGRLALGGGTTKGHGYFEAININLDELDKHIESAQPQPKKRG